MIVGQHCISKSIWSSHLGNAKFYSYCQPNLPLLPSTFQVELDLLGTLSQDAIMERKRESASELEIAQWLWGSRCGTVEEHLWQQFSTWTLPPQGLSYPSHSAATAPTPPCVLRLAASTVNELAPNNGLRKETELGCRQETERERETVESRD